MTTARADTACDDEQAQQASAADGNTGLTEDTKQQIRDALAAMAETPGFRSRAVQRRMIAEVAKTLAGEYDGDERVLCIEGPTGTGKSLGYLLPAIPVAQAREKTLIIASATVALQEQLVEKDLPDLLGKTGMDFTFALAKGRRRYVCDRKLERLAGVNRDQKDLDFGEDDAGRADWSIKPQQGEVEQVRRMWQARENETFSGDLDEWATFIRPELYEELTTDRNGCIGKSCPLYSRCAFLTARRQLGETDVIVANHALVMADLLLGGGVVLPAPEDAIYVFDEGHHLPAVAINQGSAQTRLIGPQSWLGDLTRVPDKGFHAVAANPDAAQDIQSHAAALASDIPRLNESLGDLQRLLFDQHPAAGGAGSGNNDNHRHARSGPGDRYRPDPNWRLSMGRVPDDLRGLFEHARDACETVCGETAKLDKAIRKAVDKEPDNRALATVQSSAQWIAARLGQMHTALAQMAAEASDEPADPPVARWIECVDQGRDFTCYAAPTSAANLLRSVLWELCDGAVVTSATLAALGRFDRYFDQAGLGEQHGSRAIRLASPFDYAGNARLCVPAVKASPKQPEAHTQEMVSRIDNGLIDLNAGTLMLFSSHRQMNAVADAVKPAVADRILVQNSAPRHQLLDTHRRRIDAGEGSILFGVASFSEGIDLPGPYCTHVIIAKIPFAVPDSPVDATYAEWLESQGRNPFMEMSVPEASFRLLQAAGRLLRTEQDTGAVTVLDRRLVEMFYGKAMMDALPPFHRDIEPKRR